MSGGHPRGPAEIQEELNRQALVEFGKRLTELEVKIGGLQEDIKDLHYLSSNSLETAKRLQIVVKGLVAKKQLEGSNPPDPD